MLTKKQRPENGMCSSRREATENLVALCGVACADAYAVKLSISWPGVWYQAHMTAGTAGHDMEHQGLLASSAMIPTGKHGTIRLRFPSTLF